MRLCFVCNEYPPALHGGIGAITQVLARALSGLGHQVRVVGLYPPGAPAPDYEEDGGVRVWRLQTPGGRWGWALARCRLFRTVARWGRRGEIDLVEVPDWEGWAAGWPSLPVPVITRLHGSISYFAAEMNGAPRRSAFWLESASLRRADFWCSVSRYTAEKTQALFRRPSPPAVLYNPVETLAGPPGPPRSSNRVVFTGTLTPKKGVVSLVKAWPRVLQACPQAELHLFGKDGKAASGQSMRATLLSLAGAAAPSLTFHGHVSRCEVIAALRQARVAVFPSYAEAFALAPLEAMGCGCPTISSTRGSGRELIEHGTDGLLVDPDDPDQIAAAVVRVLADDALAARLGEEGRRRVRRDFGLPHVVAQNEAFYRRCLDAFQGRRRPGRYRVGNPALRS